MLTSAKRISRQGVYTAHVTLSCDSSITYTKLLPLLQVLPLVVELSKRVVDKAAADTAAGGGLFDVSDAAKRITSDVMGHMLLGEDLGGTQWK